MGHHNGANIPVDARQLTRPRYFPRQQVTAADLTAEQDYFRERLRRHNRLAHGYGVVCGLEVVAVYPDSDAAEEETAPSVIVTAGYALSPQGDEIYVPDQQTVLLECARDASGDCTNLEATPVAQQVYIALRYREDEIQPKPVLPYNCAPAVACEYSRTRAGFELACLDYLPESSQPTLVDCEAALRDLCRRSPPQSLDDISPLFLCPPEITDPWIALACVNIDADGEATIDYTIRPQLMPTQILQALSTCNPSIFLTDREDNDMIKFTKEAKIATGASRPEQWVQYTDPSGIYVDVDTSAAGFTRTPTYITALHGSSSHWSTSGATSVYQATPSGFRIYVRWTSGDALTPARAQELGWHIQWIGIED